MHETNGAEEAVEESQTREIAIAGQRDFYKSLLTRVTIALVVIIVIIGFQAFLTGLIRSTQISNQANTECSVQTNVIVSIDVHNLKANKEDPSDFPVPKCGLKYLSDADRKLLTKDGIIPIGP